MTKRVAKMDPTWMEALGFTLVDDARVDTLQWRNSALRLQVRDTQEPATVIRMYTDAVSLKATKVQQAALREVLLPAMGLEVHEEYDADGYTKRTYVRPE